MGGSLVKVRAHDLAAQVITSLLERSGVDPALLDDVILGDCCQAPDEANTARTAMLKAGIPVDIPAVTIQRQCSSAMQAMGMAATYIKAGEYELALAGGVESMSNAPYVSYDTRWGARLAHKGLQDSLWEMLHSGSPILDPPGYIMGQTAENLARKYDISRQDQDEVALPQPQQRRGGHHRRQVRWVRSCPSRCPSARATPRFSTPTSTCAWA